MHPKEVAVLLVGSFEDLLAVDSLQTLTSALHVRIFLEVFTLCDDFVHGAPAYFVVSGEDYAHVARLPAGVVDEKSGPLVTKFTAEE